MLDVTVKTLDGKNTPFTVDDNMTVKNFKDHISGAIGIPADQQRIIFKGKVLQDDAKLADSDVAGKVVHVVLRPPPSTSSSAGSASAAGTAAAPPGRRPAAAPSQPRRAAQPPAGTSVMVASFSLPGDLTDTRQISSIVENVMRGIGPSGGVHIHSRSDPMTSVDVHIDLHEAPHDAHSGPGFPGGAPGGRGAEQLASSQPGFLGGVEPRRCLQQIQGFVGELDQMVDDIEHLRVDGAASVDSSGAATESAPRRPRSSHPAQSGRPSAHDDGTGRVPVSSLADVLSQVAAVTSRLQPLIELYSNRVRECAAAPASRAADEDPQAATASALGQARSESSGPGSSRPAEIRNRDQLLFDGAAEAMHILGHILHNASDLMVDWSRPPQEREVILPPMLGMPALMVPRGPLMIPVGVTTQSTVLVTPSTQPQPQPGSTTRPSGSAAGASQPSSGQPTASAQPQAANGNSGGQQPVLPAQFLPGVQLTAGAQPMFFVQMGPDQVSQNNSAAQSGQVPAAAVIGPSLLAPQNMPGVPPVFPFGTAVPGPAAFMPFGFGLAPASAAGPAGNVAGPAANQPSAAPAAPPAGPAGPLPGTMPGLQFAAGMPPFAFLPQQQLLHDMVRHITGSLQLAGQPPPAYPSQQTPPTSGSATASGPVGSPSSGSRAPPPLPEAGHPQVVVLPPVVVAPEHPYAPPSSMPMPVAMVPPVVVPLLPSQPSLPHAQQPSVSRPHETASTRPTGSVANAGSQQPSALQNPSLNTAGQLPGSRHGSANQADIYLPCNSIFWHPNVLPIVRQLNLAHQPPTSIGSAAGVVDSRGAARSNVGTETVRAQLRAREADNIATTQFHTMLSAIVNSVINRAMRPSDSSSATNGRAATGATIPDVSGSPSGGTMASSTRPAEAATTNSSQVHMSRPAAGAAAGDTSGLSAPEQDIFDSAAFSSVLPAAIEQLAAFASFVAEPQATDSRPVIASSRGTSTNALPDDLFMQLMAAVAQEVAPGGSSQRPPSTIQDFLQRMASSHGFVAESPTSAAAGIIHSLFEIISRHLTFADLQRLYDGDPNCLDRLRSPLSAFVRSQVLNDGPTSNENVSAAVDRLVEEWGPHLSSGLAGIETIGDIDLSATVKQFARVHIKRLVHLILTSPGARSAPPVERSFGSQLNSLVRDSMINLCQLLLHCLGNNVEALLQCVYAQVEALFGGASTVVVGMTSSLIASQVRSMISQFHLTSASAGEDRIQQYLVKQVQSDRAAATQQSVLPLSTSTSQAPVQPSVEADRLVLGPDDDSSSYESAEENGHEMEIAKPEAATQRDSTAPSMGTTYSEGSQAVAPAPTDTRLPRDPGDCSDAMDVAVPSGDSSIKSESTRTSNTAASPADDWRSQVPQDWVPVIECDQRRQSEAAASGGLGGTEQQPFSEAYLSGVPAKKRKVVQPKEEPGPTSSNN